MATQTTNLNLTKPDYTDTADIGIINANMDKIDSAVYSKASSTSVASIQMAQKALSMGGMI